MQGVRGFKASFIPKGVFTFIAADGKAVTQQLKQRGVTPSFSGINGTWQGGGKAC